MADSLTVSNSLLTGVRPSLDELGQISAMHIDVALSYSNADGNPVASRTITLNIWNIMTEQQRINMQDIQNTIKSYIIDTYFV